MKHISTQMIDAAIEQGRQERSESLAVFFKALVAAFKKPTSEKPVAIGGRAAA